MYTSLTSYPLKDLIILAKGLCSGNQQVLPVTLNDEIKNTPFGDPISYEFIRLNALSIHCVVAVVVWLGTQVQVGP